MENTKTRKGITRLWWIPLITGICCIGLGIWTFCCPAESLPVMAMVFAACLLAAGIMNLGYSCMATGRSSNWGWSMALGILEIIAGVWMISIPEAALTAAFMYIVGIWIMVVAINSLCEATMMASSPGSIIWMIIVLIATLAFAVIFLFNPIAGGVAVWLWLGLSLVTYGIYRIILAFKVKKIYDFTHGEI